MAHSGYERIGRSVPLDKAKRSCLDKRRHESRNDARDFAAKQSTKYPDNTPQRPYRCTLCNGFHLTTIKKESP